MFKISKDLYTPDFVAVARSFQIKSTKKYKNFDKVFVEWDYIGVHKGNSMRFYNPQNGSKKLLFCYIVENNAIKNGNKPLIGINIYQREIERSIAESAKILNNESCNKVKKEHFRNKIESYKSIYYHNSFFN